MKTRRLGVSAALLLIAAGWAGTHLSDAMFTSSTVSAANQISAAADWTPPQVSLVVPDSPLEGTVLLQASGDDPEGSATTVRIDLAPAGSGTWTQICGPAGSPLECSWDTETVEDGSYDLRATATDSSGNSSEEVATGLTVENDILCIPLPLLPCI